MDWSLELVVVPVDEDADLAPRAKRNRSPDAKGGQKDGPAKDGQAKDGQAKDGAAGDGQKKDSQGKDGQGERRGKRERGTHCLSARAHG